MTRDASKRPAVVGRGGGGGGGHGGGGRGGGHGGGHGRGGRGRIPGGIRRGGGVWGGGPWVYDVVPYGEGIEVDDLTDAIEHHKNAAREVAKEVVHQLDKGQVKLGEDLDCLDAELLGEEKSAAPPAAGKGGSSSGGGLFGDFGLGTLFQTAGSLAQAGVNLYESEKAKQDAEAASAKSSAQERAKLEAAISADVNAAVAAARAAFSAQSKLASAAVDASAASQAAAAQARAGASLSPESVEKRLEAANRALAAATAKAQANPKDAYALALMNAWTATTNKIQNVQITDPGPTGFSGPRGASRKGGGHDHAESWLDRLLHWLHLK